MQQIQNRPEEMSITIEQLLESITEAIRKQRRYGVRVGANGPKFPTPYDLSRIIWNTEHQRIELDLLDNGVIRKFDLRIDEVEFHGEYTVDADDTESESESE